MAYGSTQVQLPEERVQIFASLPFIGFHFVALAAAILTPPSAGDIALCIGMYYLRMFGIGAGFHRYFAHRTYSTSRAFQFFMAFLGGTAMQKGGLWWASNHRHHHRYSDQPQDVHSPVQRGFLWSHVGWILASKWEKTDYEAIPDMAKYPELRFLNRYHMLPPVVFAAVLTSIGWLAGGQHGAIHALVWGFVVSTVVLWHGTFTINSLSHVFGRRRFKTTDDSRNSLALALITNGEGWHNNHHYYPGSMSNGFYWWQVDLNAYVIRTLERVGLVWDVRAPPERVLKLGREGLRAQADAQGPPLDPAAEPAA
jgi:stearoyl-CoA desaturase (Delta-9 desaturase)